MFVGHFGVGFGAKAASPTTSLGTLFLAAQFIDLLWPTLLLLNVEQVRIAEGITAFTPLDFVSYPITHSLIMSAVWGLALGALVGGLRRSWRVGTVVGLAVLSHWVLDFVTHRPDLPLLPGDSARVGLGLWNSVAGTLVVELALFAVGLALYLRVSGPTDRTGKWGLVGLVAFLALVYVSNLLGPPPPNVRALAWVAQAQWLLVGWAYWVDRHRQALST